MKAALMGGALAFALFGAPAIAGGDNVDNQQVGQRECPPELIGTAECPEALEQDQGLGGAGEQGTFEQDQGLGEEPIYQDEGMQDEGLGGAGAGDDFGAEPIQDEQLGEDEFRDDDFVGGAGQEGAPVHQEPMTTEPRTQTWEEDRTQVTVVQEGEERRGTRAEDMRGVTVLLGGGVEGYTGELAPEINPGPQWGVSAAFRPAVPFGVELGYTGAVNNIPGEGADLFEGEGANITRHGGSAVATFGLGAAAVQPYVLGGIGIDRYIVNNAENYQSNTIGNVPLGVGLRSQMGAFTADLRGNYGVLFEQGFAPEVGNTNLRDIGTRTPTGRYGASLKLGATF